MQLKNLDDLETAMEDIMTKVGNVGEFIGMCATISHLFNVSGDEIQKQIDQGTYEDNRNVKLIALVMYIHEMAFRYHAIFGKIHRKYPNFSKKCIAINGCKEYLESETEEIWGKDGD